MAATYRRVNMKALARYQIILLGEQRHIGVNNLPDNAAAAWESNSRPAHHESSALTTTPPSHTGVCSKLSYKIYFLMLWLVYVTISFSLYAVVAL